MQPNRFRASSWTRWVPHAALVPLFVLTPRTAWAFQSDEEDPWDWLGMSLAAFDDLDGDGVGEFLVGDPLAGEGGCGLVWVISGKTRQPIRRVEGIARGSYCGLGTWVTGVDDLDGDGVRDFAACAIRGWSKDGNNPGCGLVLVLSGADGHRILCFDSPIDDVAIGDCVANAGDLDGDGRPDLAVSAAPVGFTVGGARTTKILLLSSSTGQSIGSIDKGVNEPTFGSRIRTAPDLDADGLPELLVEVSLADRTTGDCMLSSRTRKPLFTKFATHGGGDLFHGSELADMDRDGRSDLLVVDGEIRSDGKLRESVHAWSGAEGTGLEVTTQPHPGSWHVLDYAQSLAVLDDLDGDGWTDYAISGATWDSSAVFEWVVARSGRNGTDLWRVHTPLGELDLLHNCGAMCSIEDVDGDGSRDLVKSVFCTDSPGIAPALLVLYSGKTGTEIARLRSKDLEREWKELESKSPEHR